MENQDKVIRREELSAHVWGQEYLESSRTVEIHVQRLRKIIAQNDAERMPFRTRPASTAHPAVLG